MRIKCAIVYGSKSEQYYHFRDAAEEYFDTVLAAPLEGVRAVFNGGTRLMYKNTDLTEFDCVHPWLFGNDLLYGEHIPEILKDQGVYTYMDVDSFSIASNKFYMMKVLAEGGLPVPRTTYTLSTTETENAANDLGYPVVIKLIDGYGGKGIMKAENESGLTPIIDTLTLFEQDICLQDYIKNPGEDIRIVVLGDETYSYKRVGGEEEWRSNISAGGHREEYDASEEMREAALKAARLCGFDFCGIDIIEGDEGFYIGEINASPGVEGTGEALGFDLAERVMEFEKRQVLRQQSEERVQ
jgi:ribosomal protein S6--L-glutamate ligase